MVLQPGQRYDGIITGDPPDRRKQMHQPTLGDRCSDLAGKSARQGGLLNHDPLGRLLYAVGSEEPLQALRSALRVRPTGFWDNHVRLERAARPRNAAMGTQRIDALIINAVIPVLHLYAEQAQNPALIDAVDDLWEALPASQDAIVRRFVRLGTLGTPRSETHASWCCSPSH